MKIAWFCIPAHGHTNPTLGLVRELVNAGHEVYYFSFDIVQDKIKSTGANYISCDSYDFEMEDKENADRVGKDIAFATELLVKSTLSLDTMVADKVREIKPDLIVSDSVAYWGKLTALKYNIPYASSTTTFAFNQHSARYMKREVGETIKMIFAMPKINKLIKQLNNKGYPVKSILDIVQNDNQTNTIVYTSKLFQPCAETFSQQYCFIGPMIRPAESEMKKTADKTIYISMGTVNQNNLVYENCIEAFRATDYQVIISMGTNEARLTDLPGHIQVYETVDQMAVLTISDIFITHCGMNSVSEGLYFETPLLLFPQTPEQAAVARRVEELGAGMKLKSIEKDDILKQVEELFGTLSYKDKARDISKSFKMCGGTKEARQFLEGLI